MHSQQTITKRSILSFLTLISQSAFLSILGLVAFYLLTKLSSVSVLGVYASVLSSLTIFNYFSDLGIAGWLIHLSNPNEDDLTTAFLTQTTLSILAIFLGLFARELIFTNISSLPKGTDNLYLATLISFAIVTLRAIPSVLLEKDHKIYLVALVSSLEGVLFYVLLIILLLLGHEIQAITYAVLARSIVGTIVMFCLNPFFPRGKFKFSSFKAMLTYGLPLQSNAFVAIVKDDLLILFLGAKIGLYNLGILQFGKKWAEFALRIVNDNLNRVTFPLFARYQSDKTHLRKYLENVYFYQFLVLLPLLAGIGLEYENLLKINLLYFQKWQASISIFYWFLFGALLVGIYSPLFSFYNALGRVKLTLFVQIIFTAVLWVSVFFILPLRDYQLVPIAFVVMSAFGLFLLFFTMQNYKVSLLVQLKTPSIASLIMLTMVFFMREISMLFDWQLYFQIFSEIVTGILAYLCCIFFLEKTVYQKLVQYISDFKHK